MPASSVTSRSRSFLIPALALAAVLTIAGALRIHHLGTESLWLDEAFSVIIARTPLTRIVQYTIDDVHPPLYYFALHYWIRIAGDGEAAARLLSVVFSLGVILAAFLLASRLAGRRPAFLAALVLTFAPFQIEFAQEARMYALLALLATVTMRAFVELITRWSGRWWAALVIATALMYYTQIHGVFVVGAQALIMIGLAMRDRATFTRVIAPWIVAQLLAVACFSPWIGPLASQVARVGGAFWIPPQTWRDVLEALVAFAGSKPIAWGLGGFAVLGAIAGWRARTPAAHPHAVLVLLCWLGSCLLGPFLVSLLGTPIFLPKYTIAASVPFAVLAGMGVARLPWEWLRTATVAGLVYLSAAPLSHYYGTARKDDWRGAAATIERAARPHDAVLFYQGFDQLPFDYYRTRRDLIEEPLPIYPSLPGPYLTPLIVKGTVQKYDRVWLVVLHGDPLEPLLVREASRWRLLKATHRTTRVDMYLFERAH